jgi:hypothetical protein
MSPEAPAVWKLHAAKTRSSELFRWTREEARNEWCETMAKQW